VKGQELKAQKLSTMRMMHKQVLDDYEVQCVLVVVTCYAMSAFVCYIVKNADVCHLILLFGWATGWTSSVL